MFPVGGFPVFCPALLSTASPCLLPPCRRLCLATRPLLTESPWPQHQMQVPGCAGGCCFRFLTAPDFSLYTIGICWEMSTRALATARPWENPPEGKRVKEQLAFVCKNNLKFSFLHSHSAINKAIKYIGKSFIIHSPSLHLSPSPSKRLLSLVVYNLSGFSYVHIMYIL